MWRRFLTKLIVIPEWWMFSWKEMTFRCILSSGIMLQIWIRREGWSLWVSWGLREQEKVFWLIRWSRTKVECFTEECRKFKDPLLTPLNIIISPKTTLEFNSSMLEMIFQMKISCFFISYPVSSSSMWKMVIKRHKMSI